jgi:hypothetical protein
VGGPFWAIAIVVPPNNKAIARPIRADLDQAGNAAEAAAAEITGYKTGVIIEKRVAVACRLVGEIKGPANNRPPHIHSVPLTRRDGPLGGSNCCLMILWWLRKRKLPASSQPRNVRPPLSAAVVE